MEWVALFGADRQPSYEDIQDYISGNGLRLWNELFAYMINSYKSKPKMTYSGCSGKPGWNIKFQKSGQSFGTLYPEQNCFSVFIVIAYRLANQMENIRYDLSDEMRERYDNAADYMKMGRWMMFQINNDRDLDDYKLLCSVKLKPLA